MAEEYIEAEFTGLDDFVVISRPEELIAMERQSSASKSSSKGLTTSDSMLPSKIKDRKSKHERKGSSKGKTSHASPLHELSPAKKHMFVKELKKSFAEKGVAEIVGEQYSKILAVSPKASSFSATGSSKVVPHMPVATSTSDQPSALRNFYKKSLQFNEKQSYKTDESLSESNLFRPKSKTSTTLSVANAPISIGDGSVSYRSAVTPLERFRVLDRRDAELRAKSIKSGGHKKMKIIGTCLDMCPEKERYSRIAKNCVAVLEMASTFDKSAACIEDSHPYMVKEYSRSSADQQEPLPHELRPIPVLELTMDYLIRNIMDLPRDAVTLAEWHDFLWDRMRAIRKDITQQELCDPQTVEIIEKCARFHIYCAEALSEEDAATFDPKINNENLTKCLQTLKHMYHDLLTKGIQCSNEAEFRSYDILLSLSEGETLRLIKDIRKDILKTDRVKLAFDAAFAYKSHLYVQFFKIFERADYLSSCILHQYIVEARVRALQIIVRAFSTRHNASQYSTARLVEDLKFENVSEALEFCRCHGLDADECWIIIDRKKFTKSASGLPVSRSSLLVSSKKTASLAKIINNGELPSKDKYTYRPHSIFDNIDMFEDKLDIPVEESGENLQVSDTEMEVENSPPAVTLPLSIDQTIVSETLNDALEEDDLKNIRSEILSELDKLDAESEQKEDRPPPLEEADTNEDYGSSDSVPTHKNFDSPFFLPTSFQPVAGPKTISESLEKIFKQDSLNLIEPDSKAQLYKGWGTFSQYPVERTSTSAFAALSSCVEPTTVSSSGIVSSSGFFSGSNFSLPQKNHTSIEAPLKDVTGYPLPISSLILPSSYNNSRSILAFSENSSSNLSGKKSDTVEDSTLLSNEEQDIIPRVDTTFENMNENSESNYGSIVNECEEKSDDAEITEKVPIENFQRFDDTLNVIDPDEEICREAPANLRLHKDLLEEMDSESLAESDHQSFVKRFNKSHEEPTYVWPFEAALLNSANNPTGIANPILSYLQYQVFYPSNFQRKLKLSEGWEPFKPLELWNVEELVKSFGSVCEPAYFPDSRSSWTFFKLCLVFPADCDANMSHFIDWILAKFSLEKSENCEHDCCETFVFQEKKIVVSVRAIFLSPRESESNYAKYINCVTAMMLFIPDSQEIESYIAELIRLRNASVIDNPFPCYVYFTNGYDKRSFGIVSASLEELKEDYSFSYVDFHVILDMFSYVENSKKVLNGLRWFCNPNLTIKRFPVLKTMSFKAYLGKTLGYFYEKIYTMSQMKGYEFIREEPYYCIKFFNKVMKFRASVLRGEILQRVEQSWPPVELRSNSGEMLIDEKIQKTCKEEMESLLLPDFRGDPKSNSYLKHYMDCLRRTRTRRRIETPLMLENLHSDADWIMKVHKFGIYLCIPTLNDLYNDSQIYYIEEDMMDVDWNTFWIKAAEDHSRIMQKRGKVLEDDLLVKKQRVGLEVIRNRPINTSRAPFGASNINLPVFKLFHKESEVDHNVTETGSSSGINSPRKILSALRRLQKETDNYIEKDEKVMAHLTKFLTAEEFVPLEAISHSPIIPRGLPNGNKNATTVNASTVPEQTTDVDEKLVNTQDLLLSRQNVLSVAESFDELYYQLQRNDIAEKRHNMYLTGELRDWCSPQGMGLGDWHSPQRMGLFKLF